MSDQSLKFVFEEDTSQRLDKFLVERIPELSRSRIVALIKNGHVTVEGEIPHKAGFSLTNGARVELVIPAAEPSSLIPEAVPLDMVFENDDVLVINKKAGMVVHPSAGHSSGTLVHAVLAHAPEIEGVGGEKRPGIVHRLDKDTSGTIILAKNDRAHRWLSDQFQDRQVGKAYLALVDGAPPTPKGRVEAPIGRDPSHRQRMAITPTHKGRDSVSEYFTLEGFDKHTLLEVRILTGRTHQIRLHMAFIKCPVVGDTVYGRRQPSLPVERQFLHAQRLSIIIPGEHSQRSFEAPLPEDLEEILTTIRR
ncbi:MAG: RluA family pseudouridine synthase [Anaerolineales bacterium]|nr:RluA family pseudouridine synthase [Chloroflexota bacterium]MBL6981413.1 RluA family pseudouridine synthase [Anaerolineales bacterium]